MDPELRKFTVRLTVPFVRHLEASGDLRAAPGYPELSKAEVHPLLMLVPESYIVTRGRGWRIFSCSRLTLSTNVPQPSVLFEPTTHETAREV